MTPTVPYGCSTFCCTDLPLRETLEQIRAQTRRIEILSEGLHDLFTYSDVCTGIAADFSVHAPCIIEVRTIGDFEQSIAYLEGLPECGHTEVLNKACGRPGPWQ